MAEENQSAPISIDDWESALNEEAQAGATPPAQDASPSAAPAAASQSEPLAALFSDLSSTGQSGDGGGIELVLDIPINVSVELGAAKVPVKNMMALGQGSVIELDGRAGDPLSIYANGHLLAKGEVVIVNDHFGIRLTQLVARPKAGV